MSGEQETIRILDLPANKADIAELIAEIRKLDEAAKNISGISIFGKAGNAGEARQQQASMAAGMEQIAQLQQKMIELENQLAAAKAKGAGAGKAKTDEEIRAQVEAAEARRKNIAVIKDQVKYDQAEIDSIVRKRIELKQLQAQYDSLSASSRSADTGKGLLTQIQEMDAGLKNLEGSTGRFQRNVGNYSGALATLEEEFKKVTAAMSQMEAKGSSVQNFGARTVVQGFGANQHQNSGPTALAGGGGVSVSVLNEDAEAYAKLSQQAGYLNTIIQKNEIGFSSVTQQIRTNEKALQSLRAAGLEGSEGFKALREETTESAREMKEFQRQQKLLESEVPALKALTLAAKGLGGAYAIGAGSAALFAEGDEKIEKEMSKMIAIMTVLQGLQEAWELIQMKGAALMAFQTTATNAATVATELFAAATGEATASMTALDAVMIMSGIGALLVALGGLIYLLSKTTESTKEYLETQTKLNEQLKEYYEAIVKANEALDEELKRQDDIAKKQIEIQEINVRSIKDELELREAKKKAAEEDIARNKTVLESLRKEQEFKEYAGKSDADMQDDLRGQYDERLRALKATQAAMKENMEQQEKNKKHGSGEDPRINDELEQQKRYITLYEKQAEAIKGKLDRVTELTDQQEESEQALKRLVAEDEKFAHEIYERKIKALTEIHNLMRGQVADYLALQTASGNGLKESEQIKGLKAEQDLRTQIILASRDQELRNEGLTGEERRLIREKANEDIFKLDVEFIGREAGLRYNAKNEFINQEIKDQADLLVMREKFIKKQEDLAKTAFEKRKANNEEDRDYILRSLDQKHVKDNPDEEKLDELKKYNDRRKEIEAQADIAILKAKEEEVKKEIDLKKQQGLDTAALDAQFANLELQIADKTAEEKKRKAKEQKAEKEKLQAAEIDLAKQAGETITSFVKAGYEYELNAIQKKIDINNKLKETETARIANSTLSQTEQAAALTRLNLQTQAQNEALQRKQRDVKVKEAQFDRDASVVKIGADTAVAIMKAVASFPLTGGEPWAAIAGAMGALQIAAVLARPIPKYEMGTDYAPGGLAILHPGEMRIDPSGKISMTSDAPESLTNLERGTKIIPAHEVNAMVMNSIFSPDAGMPADNRLLHEMRDLKEAVVNGNQDQVRAIRKIKAPIINISNDAVFFAHIEEAVRK